MLKKPVINFHIKPFDIRLDFLYNYQYCKMFQADYKIEEVESAIKHLMTEDFLFCQISDTHFMNESEKIYDQIETYSQFIKVIEYCKNFHIPKKNNFNQNLMGVSALCVESSS